MDICENKGRDAKRMQNGVENLMRDNGTSSLVGIATEHCRADLRELSLTLIFNQDCCFRTGMRFVASVPYCTFSIHVRRTCMVSVELVVMR